MIDSLHHAETVSELAIVLSTISLLAVGLLSAWTRKKIRFIISHVCNVRDNTDEAIRLVKQLMEKTDEN